jgi:GAF domain-containing protein
VFAAMLENATRICGAKFGTLARFDGNAFHIVAEVDTPPELVEFLRRRGPFQAQPGSRLDEVVRTKQASHTADAAADAVPGASAKFGGARSFIIVPMVKDNLLIGVIAIYRQEVRPFSDKQIELVKNFAAQAVIAIENVRLLNELRQRTDDLGRSIDELRALGEVSQAVNSTLDLETVLSTIVAKAVQLSGTEAGAIYVFDKEQREFRLRSTYGMDQALIDALTQQHIGFDDPNITPGFLKGDPIQVPDLREGVSSAANEIILRAGFRALLVTPFSEGRRSSACLSSAAALLVPSRRIPLT